MAMADVSGMFAGVRQQLLEQREQIAERLAAVDEAEAALARVRDVFRPPPSR
jgi:hypothetical protein